MFIMPLQLFFEVIFAFAQRFTDDPGLSIIILSLTVNFLVLPLYKRADAIQALQREKEKQMQPGVSHIKKVFSGDEKLMILQTYYSQNDYKPYDILKESISLFLQIPFFTAAYQFLSKLALLDGVSFGPISDLGRPDGLLVIGGLTFNFLPILMTVINIISGMIYTRGLPLKSKIQLYGLAAFFLVFLYPSPSGLVFYWTLNNLFSLVKNIFFKLKDPVRVLTCLSSVVGFVLVLYSALFFDNTLKRRAIVVFVGLILQIPLLLRYLKGRISIKSGLSEILPSPDRKRFILEGIFLSLLTGALIPSAVIKASPLEFVYLNLYQNPVWYVIYSLCLSFGTFVIWIGVFYSISEDRGKTFMEMILWAFSGIAAVDYMFFGTDLGTIFPNLQFQKDVIFSSRQKLFNLMVLLVLSLVLILVFIYLKKAVLWVLLTVVITVLVMTGVNIRFIRETVQPVEQTLSERQDEAKITLSRDKENVIVFMLDRAVGPYVSYIMNEKPELKESFDGFTWYSNVISFGGKTNFGTPALFGGYEYSPVEMNKRSEEALKDKQNEALKVMPALFGENDFDVTVCDPPYANYRWIPDLSIYSDLKNVKAFTSDGLIDEKVLKLNITNNRRNFFFYGLMKVSPLFAEQYIYNGGRYNRLARRGDVSTVQTTEGHSKAKGVETNFRNAFSFLENLSEITVPSEGEAGSLVILTNDATHEPILLREPEYVPAEDVDNVEYDESHMDRFTVNGRKMEMDTPEQFAHYETNVACFLQLGKWFEFMKDNDVYDNTRIILVSDHGERLNQFDELMLDTDDVEGYACLLMVKDFNSHGFKESTEFMTTGDVPSLAAGGVIDEPKNPFTGRPINSGEKTAHDQYITCSEDWDILVNNGNQFLPSDWLSVHDDIWDRDNWKVVAENSVFTGEE